MSEPHYSDDHDGGDEEWVSFTPEELTMLHRAVRQKLSRVRNDMARDRRKYDDLHYARSKARALAGYAALLIRLDRVVPEDQR